MRIRTRQAVLVVRKLPAKAGDLDSVPGLGRSFRARNGNPLQYSWLEKSMDRGAWWATVHGAPKSQTWLSDWKHPLPYQNRREVVPCLGHLRSVLRLLGRSGEIYFTDTDSSWAGQRCSAWILYFEAGEPGFTYKCVYLWSCSVATQPKERKINITCDPITDNKFQPCGWWSFFVFIFFLCIYRHNFSNSSIIFTQLSLAVCSSHIFLSCWAKFTAAFLGENTAKFL